MAVNDLIAKIFSTNAKVDMERVKRDQWLEEKRRTETQARADAKRCIDWYNRNTDRIREYMLEQAAKTFKRDEVVNWHFPVINSVARVVKRISMAYKTPPKRYLVRDGERLDMDAPEYDAVFGKEGMYRNIDLIRRFKEFDNMSTLLNTIHVEVVPRDGAIAWDLRLRSAVMIVEDPMNYLDFVKFAHYWEPVDPDTLIQEKGWIIWDDKQHVFQLGNGYRIGMTMDDGSNPYPEGMIPIVTIRKLEQDDYWGRYGQDLVDAMQAFHVQLANAWEIALLQTHGQPIAVNLGFMTGSEVLIGPSNPITVNNVTKDDIMPALIFAKPETDIDKVTEMLKWFMESEANSYGMPAGSWSQDEVPESGFAKFVNNAELLENRDDNILQWKEVEKELFVISRTVYNMFGDGKQIAEDLELEVEFEPVEFIESPIEETTRYTLLIKSDLSSRVRYFMETRGLEHDEAQSLAEEVAEENKKDRDAKMPEGMDQFLNGVPLQPGEPGQQVPPGEEGEESEEGDE